MDLFTTFARLAELKVPEDRVIDGINLMDALFSGTEVDRPVFFYRGNLLFAVRSGPYKMHLWTWTTPQSELDQVLDHTSNFDQMKVKMETWIIGTKY